MFNKAITYITCGSGILALVLVTVIIMSELTVEDDRQSNSGIIVAPNTTDGQAKSTEIIKPRKPLFPKLYKFFHPKKND
jgi:hypothetical protein